MVEEVAKFMKKEGEKFLIEAEKIENQQEGGNAGWVAEMAEKVQITREFLGFINNKWEEDREGRDMTKSIHEVQMQQEKVAGSSVVLDRINSRLANFQEDPFFLKEQLHLFRWRLAFFHKFFPVEAIIAAHPAGPMGPLVRRIGWWWCPLAGSRLMPEANLVATKFSEVVEAAFNVKMDEDDPNVGVIFKQDDPSLLGDMFDYKFGLIYDWTDEEEEIRCFKIVLGVEEDEIEVGDQMSLSYLQRVLWALHKAGPPPLMELAARKVIQENIIPVFSFEKMTEAGFWGSDECKKWIKMMEEIPEEVLDYIQDGPLPKPEELNERGRNVWDALMREADDRMVAYEEEVLDQSDDSYVEDSMNDGSI